MITVLLQGLHTLVNAHMKRLGRIEKFILLDLLSFGRRAGYSAKDRSQCVYTLFSMLTGSFESNYKSNVKFRMNVDDYQYVQQAVTRAAQSLQKAGYITIEPRALFTQGQLPKVLRRKRLYELTGAGTHRAQALAASEGLDPSKLTRRVIMKVLERAKLPSQRQV